ncbi:DUF11 domain-containing protein [Patescibacteria group bacterium]|nr:DUF11 domain-containing protein [Patescibacteria group bacterium]
MVEIKINRFGQQPAQPPQQPRQPQQQPAGQPQIPPQNMPKQSFFKQNKWPIIIIVICLLVLGAAAYMVFRKPSGAPSQPKITLQIDAPNQTPSGAQIVYNVKIANNDNSTIQNVTLDLIYPQGFTYADSSPKPTKLDGSEFSLPAIDPGVQTSITISGAIQGNAEETKTITGILHYTFANLNSNYVAQAQSQTQIQTANVVLQITGPQTATNSQDLNYSLSYSNFTSNPVSNFQVTLNLPVSFKVIQYGTKPSTQTPLQAVWQIGSLDPNQSGTITFTGSFTNANTGDQQQFTAQAQGSTNGNPVFSLSATQLAVSIGTQPIEADVVLGSGNSSGSTTTAKPGDTLQYEVDYKNNGASSVNGVNVEVDLTGPYDLSTVQASNASVSGNKIIWDASQVSNLNQLGAGESGKLLFSVRVKNPVTTTNQSNLTIDAKPQIKSAEYQQAFAGQDLALKVSSVPQISGTVTYSSGANPPAVGQSTTYTIEIDLRNTTNDISNAQVIMNLPNTFNFDLSDILNEERPNVQYDRSTKKLTWNVGTLAANAGSFTKIRKLVFNAVITPAESSKNQPVTLVNNIAFSGTDSFTNESDNLNIQDLTTLNDTSTSTNGFGGIVQ